MAAYRASGGLHGAVARLAEAAFGELDPHRQAIARSIFLRLAGPGAGSDLVRRRVALGELDADRDPTVESVLDRLTSARLLTSGDGFVEVAHEALLREWPRLQGWLEEDAAGRAVRLHLIGAVRDWEQRDRDPADLYRGARLAAALEWAREHQVDLNVAERDFLDASRQASEREVERQRRANQVLRGLLAGAALLLVVAVGGLGFAAVQARRAEDEAQRAEQQRALAEDSAASARARELTASAVAVMDEDPGLSKLLAIQAASTSADRPRDLATILHQVLAADAIVDRYRWAGSTPPSRLWTDIDPTGTRLVASGDFLAPSDHLEVVDLSTGAARWSFPQSGQEAEVGPSFFTLDGTRVIAGLYWHALDIEPSADVPLGLFIFDAQSGAVEKRIDLGPCGGLVTSVSETRVLIRTARDAPDDFGQQLCDWGAPAVTVIDLASGRSTLLAAEAADRVPGTLSRDGRFAAFDGVAAADGSVASIVVNADTGRPALEIEDSPGVRGLSRDGALLLVGDRPLQVYDVASGVTEILSRTWVGPGATSPARRSHRRTTRSMGLRSTRVCGDGRRATARMPGPGLRSGAAARRSPPTARRSSCQAEASQRRCSSTGLRGVTLAP